VEGDGGERRRVEETGAADCSCSAMAQPEAEELLFFWTCCLLNGSGTSLR
jgi:hypothetical protein